MYIKCKWCHLGCFYYDNMVSGRGKGRRGFSWRLLSFFGTLLDNWRFDPFLPCVLDLDAAILSVTVNEDSDWQIFHIFAQLDAVHSLGILYFSQLNVFDSHTPWCLAIPQYHEEVSQFGIESNCEFDGFGKSRSFKREPQHSGLPVKSFFHCCASGNSLSGVETEVLTFVLTQVFSSCQMLSECYCKGPVLKFSWGRWPRTRVEFTAAPIHQLHCQMLL